MTENINFIPANELPVAEGDEVSVLCLENGEMKQKPANGLGGGGGMFPVGITLGENNWGNPSSVTFDKTFAEIAVAIGKGCTVIGYVMQPQFTGDQLHQFCGGYIRVAFPIPPVEIDGDEYITFLPTDPEYVGYWICSDDRTGINSD